MVNEILDPVTVILERFDPHGTPLSVDEETTGGMVVQVVLISEDGSIDCDLTESGELLLVGENSKSPEIIDGKIVTKFNSLKVRRTGVFRFRARMFNIYNTALSISLSTEEPLRVPADALFNDISDVFIVYDATG
ncbi:hypothetical protein IWW48_001260 [Coemansia sp. RSA 1200]|nr:hypothetical protein IWW48_001260 [Coemansia sp. RSA 1200]